MYYCFSRKNDILYFILSNYMDLILNHLVEDLRGIEGNREKLQYIISGQIKLNVKNASEAKILLHEAHFLQAKYFRNH